MKYFGLVISGHFKTFQLVLELFPQTQPFREWTVRDRGRRDGHLRQELCRILCHHLPPRSRRSTSRQSSAYKVQVRDFANVSHGQSPNKLACLLGVSSFQESKACHKKISKDENFFLQIREVVSYWFWLHPRPRPETDAASNEAKQRNDRSFRRNDLRSLSSVQVRSLEFSK